MAGSYEGPFFKTCGITISLGSDQPELVNIMHSTPKYYYTLAKQRDDEAKCDFTISIGEKRLYGHKAVLTSRIPYFRALFDSEITESATGEINLSSALCEFDFEALESLLNYAYSGLLTISVTNVQHLMMGALYFNMEFVIDECARFISRRISVDNAIPLFSFFRSIAYKKMNDFILRFIDKNFVPISCTAAFLKLNIKSLVSLLKRNSINIDDENQVFEAVSRWVGHYGHRNKYSARLLKHVRCTRLSQNFIADVVEKTGWVIGNADCRSLVNEAKDYISCKERKGKMCSFKNAARVCEEAHRLIVFICTKSDKPWENSYCSSHVYDVMTNTWIKCVIPVIPRYGAIVAVDQKIYFFGTKKQQIFDAVSNQLHPMPGAMPESDKKLYAASGVIDGKIYFAGGGYFTTSIESSVACFCTSTHVWFSVAAMSKKRWRPAACVLDGKLYVFGGYDPDEQTWKDGECYDPKTDSWSPIGPMNIKRRCFNAVSLNGQIYVAGGYDGYQYLNDVERYDPVTDSWTRIKSMKTKRTMGKLVVSCGKLIVFGGQDNDDSSVITSVEMYHPETDSWEDRQPLPEDNAIAQYVGTIPIPASIPSPASDLEATFSSSHSSGFRCLLSNEDLLRAVSELGLKNPSRMQHELTPKAVRGKDVNCQARSCSGKTTLFVMATLDQLEPVDGEVSVLVLCHTRELASHVSSEFEKFSKYLSEIKVARFTGDTRITKNRGVLKNNCPHIVIGTPGRILALVQSGVMKMNKIKSIVLDKCDIMFSDQVIRTEVEKIVKLAPKEKQVMLFSTALSTELRNVCRKFIHEERCERK